MIATAVLLCAIVPLLPTLRAPFLYDDTTIIRDNPLLRGWASLVHVWSLPYWSGDGGEALGLYRPTQQAMLALVWNIGKGSALLFHSYALLLAAATAIAVWWLLRRAVGETASLVAAMWFATHPLHVEAVASVANTSELLVALCTIGLVWLLGQRGPLSGTLRSEFGHTAAIGLAGCQHEQILEIGVVAERGRLKNDLLE